MPDNVVQLLQHHVKWRAYGLLSEFVACDTEQLARKHIALSRQLFLLTLNFSSNHSVVEHRSTAKAKMSGQQVQLRHPLYVLLDSWTSSVTNVISCHSSVIFLLHIALDIPVAIQGLWSPFNLPFLQLNNTAVVFIKVR